LNGELVTQEQLEQQLQPAGSAPEQRSVVIKADKRLAYGKVIEVMGLCQGAGIADIAVAVK
jgi:biopolymer transport protein ExbD